MTIRIKYPRTPHLPFSEGKTNDDKVLADTTHFNNKNIIITTKMDGENCLDGDTLISTELGPLSIQDICENSRIGLNVYSFNIDTYEKELTSIEKVFIADDSEEWFEIEMEDGTILRITGDHYVWVDNLNCYRKVKDLTIDDELLTEKLA